MKTSALLCAALAGTLGFSSLASAREWNGDNRGHDRDQRFEQRFEQRHDGRAERHEDRRVDRGFQQGFRAGAQAQRHVQPAPNYGYGYGHGYDYGRQPVYRAPAPRFYQGGYLPYQYRDRAYYVNDWRAYRGLYAPPYGHQWVNVDGDFLLVALATGLIATALLN
ncbi:hypothetical protein GCM10028796_21080 [Ramlibacter monticola]|uniref:RcnB family protein n=1 Tax=Ramlibacter monticola TaxID=1926872 RepID=A0A936Z172_9BURK|nr:RcnB family protein [Ramlibacter monticola]MBL0392361.1 RcnB family protein [Ramlibacter monticola]